MNNITRQRYIISISPLMVREDLETLLASGDKVDPKKKFKITNRLWAEIHKKQDELLKKTETIVPGKNYLITSVAFEYLKPYGITKNKILADYKFELQAERMNKNEESHN